jgi:hypothetical protein
MRCVEYLRHRDAIFSPHLSAKTGIEERDSPGLTKDLEITRMPSNEDRMKIMESYVGILKLKKPLTLEEIFELEEDNWLY